MINIKANNNGDSIDNLVDELRDALDKVSAATDAINALTVHGRNYQTCEDPDKAFSADRAWRGNLHNNLEQMHSAMTDAAMNLMDQK